MWCNLDMWSRLLPEQQLEVFSPDNIWLAGKVCGHSPNQEEAIMHYYQNTGHLGVMGLHFIPFQIEEVEITQAVPETPIVNQAA
jgi:hypothetical protein